MWSKNSTREDTSDSSDALVECSVDPPLNRCRTANGTEFGGEFVAVDVAESVLHPLKQQAVAVKALWLVRGSKSSQRSHGPSED